MRRSTVVFQMHNRLTRCCRCSDRAVAYHTHDVTWLG